MLKSKLPLVLRRFNPQFNIDLQVTFPTIDDLIDKASRTTHSCVHMEQLEVSREFYKNVVTRGFYRKKYTLDDAKRVGIIVDHMVQARAKALSTADAI